MISCLSLCCWFFVFFPFHSIQFLYLLLLLLIHFGSMNKWTRETEKKKKKQKKKQCTTFKCVCRVLTMMTTTALGLICCDFNCTIYRNEWLCKSLESCERKSWTHLKYSSFAYAPLIGASPALPCQPSIKHRHSHSKQRLFAFTVATVTTCGIAEWTQKKKKNLPS